MKQELADIYKNKILAEASEKILNSLTPEELKEMLVPSIAKFIDDATEGYKFRGIIHDKIQEKAVEYINSPEAYGRKS